MLHCARMRNIVIGFCIFLAACVPGVPTENQQSELLGDLYKLEKEDSIVEGPTTKMIEREIIFGDGGYWSYFPCDEYTNLGDGTMYMAKDAEDVFCRKTVTVLKEEHGVMQPHARYENVFDGAVRDDGQYIALYNATKQPDGAMMQLRIIHIESKEYVRLPLIACTYDVIGFGRDHLVTASAVDFEDNARVRICIWDMQGNLVEQFSGQRFVTATTDHMINQIGMLPRDPHILYTVVTSPESEDPEHPSCLLVLQDVHDTSRSKTIPFTVEDDYVYFCAGNLELDVSNTTFDNPQFEYWAD